MPPKLQELPDPPTYWEVWPEERRRDAAERLLSSSTTCGDLHHRCYHYTLATFDFNVSLLHFHLISIKNMKLQCFGILFFFFKKELLYPFS